MSDFALPSAELFKGALPDVARAPAGGFGLALDDTGRIGSGLGVIRRDTAARRPAASQHNGFYYETDTRLLWYSDGSTWTAINAGQHLIQEIDLTSVTTFSSIPNTFEHLRIEVVARSSQAAVAVNNFMRLNADSAGNYDYTRNRGNNNAIASLSSVAQTEAGIGPISAANATADHFGQSETVIYNYAGTGRKGYTSAGQVVATAAAADMFLDTYGGHWRNTAAITSILIIPNAGNAYASGSRAWLYGMVA